MNKKNIVFTVENKQTKDIYISDKFSMHNILYHGNLDYDIISSVINRAEFSEINSVYNYEILGFKILEEVKNVRE